MKKTTLNEKPKKNKIKFERSTAHEKALVTGKTESEFFNSSKQKLESLCKEDHVAYLETFVFILNKYSSEHWEPNPIFSLVSTSQGLANLNNANFQTVEKLSNLIFTSIQVLPTPEKFRVYCNLNILHVVKLKSIVIHVQSFIECLLSQFHQHLITKQIIFLLNNINAKAPLLLKDLKPSILSFLCQFLDKYLSKQPKYTNYAVCSMIISLTKTINSYLFDFKNLKESELKILYEASCILIYLGFKPEGCNQPIDFDKISGSNVSSSSDFQSDHSKETIKNPKIEGALLKIRYAALLLLHIIIKNYAKFILNNWSRLLVPNSLVLSFEKKLFKEGIVEGKGIEQNKISLFITENFNHAYLKQNLFFLFHEEKNLKLKNLLQQILSSLIECLPFNKWLIGYKRDGNLAGVGFQSLTSQASNILKTCYYMTYFELLKTTDCTEILYHLKILQSLFTSNTFEMLPQVYCQDILDKTIFPLFFKIGLNPDHLNILSLIFLCLSVIIDKASNQMKNYFLLEKTRQQIEKMILFLPKSFLNR